MTSTSSSKAKKDSMVSASSISSKKASLVSTSTEKPKKSSLVSESRADKKKKSSMMSTRSKKSTKKVSIVHEPLVVHDDISLNNSAPSQSQVPLTYRDMAYTEVGILDESSSDDDSSVYVRPRDAEDDVKLVEQDSFWFADLATGLAANDATKVNLALLTDFFNENDPSRLPEVKQLLEDNKGQEEELFQDLTDYYNLSPQPDLARYHSMRTIPSEDRMLPVGYSRVKSMKLKPGETPYLEVGPDMEGVEQVQDHDNDSLVLVDPPMSPMSPSYILNGAREEDMDLPGASKWAVNIGDSNDASVLRDRMERMGVSEAEILAITRETLEML